MVRIHLSGHVALEGPAETVHAPDFPGRQGREVFAFLVMNRRAPVPRSDIAAAIWGERFPTSWDAALSAIVSKLRVQFSRAGLDGARALRSADGCYQLDLPSESWIDHDVAFDSIHLAEAALRAGDFRDAYGPSAIARAICQRPFLPGSEAEWLEARRVKLRRTLVRALECRAAFCHWNEEFPLAIEAAREAIAIEPFRESAYRQLMRAHAAAGNTAEALRVYERCRALISEELGVPPSPETRRAHEEILEAVREPAG